MVSRCSLETISCLAQSMYAKYISADQGVILNVMDKPRFVIEKGRRPSESTLDFIRPHLMKQARSGASKPKNLFLPMDYAKIDWSSSFLIISFWSRRKALSPSLYNNGILTLNRPIKQYAVSSGRVVLRLAAHDIF